MALTLAVVFQVRKIKARKKLETLKLEQCVISKLMKETQNRRFVSGGMSSMSYKIRMDKFKERLTEIKHTVPVLEARLEGKIRSKAYIFITNTPLHENHKNISIIKLQKYPFFHSELLKYKNILVKKSKNYHRAKMINYLNHKSPIYALWKRCFRCNFTFN